jgi:hypothetical protein
VTITASGATQGTFNWTVQNGSLNAKATLEGGVTSLTKTDSNSIQVTSTAQSFSSSDKVAVILVFTPTGQSALPAQTITTTIESPYSLHLLATSNHGTYDCISAGSNGYDTRITYEIRSRLGGVAVANAYINENFGIRTDVYTMNSWPNGDAKGVQTPDAQFADQLCAFNDGSLVPTAQVPQLGTTQIYRREQTWRSGSNMPGQGISVQGDDIYMFRDHGEHHNIH